MLKLLLPLLVGFTLSSHGAIDLTPSPSEYTAEGITFRRLSFTDGQRRVVYEPPRLWSYRGGGTNLQLMPPNTVRADASIQVADVITPRPFDENLMAVLKEEALRTAPPGAQKVALVKDEVNPLQFARGDAYAVTLTYQSLGETFVRSVLYVNIPDVRLTFRITARKADFDPLQRAFRASILSWHWVEDAPSTTVAQK